MGLFSRRDKIAKADLQSTPAPLNTSYSNSSVHSAGSMSWAKRTSAGSATNGTSSISSPPLISPRGPVKMPKMDMPRPPDPNLDPAGYLRSLVAVRERSQVIYEKALRDDLAHFDVDMDKMSDVVSFVTRLIRRDFDAPYTSIPPHSRYQHFCVGGRDRIAQLLSTWPSEVDNTERCRRLIDLFLVSVLIDAGAGTEWSYKSSDNGRVYRRSEGIAIASLEMFKSGLFSGDSSNRAQVDKVGLRALTPEKLAAGLQSRPGNEIVGVEGRAELLIKLAEALEEKNEFFGGDGRPGHMVDHILSHPSTQASSMPIVPLTVLWNILINGLSSIWPQSRTSVNGIPLGDAWPCQSMPRENGGDWETILPFHKLTQWLAYSVMQPMQSLLRIHFAGTELLTGLPEYRNGGLFVDLGVLNLKSHDMDRGLENYSDYCRRTNTKGIEVAPMFETGDDVVVEWRAATIGLLDRLCLDVNMVLKKDLAGNQMTLQQLLEAGSWKACLSLPNIMSPRDDEN
ncbi:Protein of unknown function (DUF1688) [Geosmithia morbida]|uniref:Uncharacterized protein n=1 Tax=Geosmithia morbida TaxID=1094350 RepID=A0A9P5D3P7_9HYPO|nr:Protein of unknown function (DUF1688) [Geosmithia morbida]KAF4120724.1 Protein of unknown function (DUF1688) [Geosmithia morbida]